jgi:NADH-quinone oxidoreductase subunit G/[NiFe] hydrogenase diaphorase moiety small subunit
MESKSDCIQEPKLRAPISTQINPVEPGKMVPITIDGIEMTVPSGMTILEAARKIGVKIPTLCHHPDLCVAGVCRICVVAVEGHRILHAACAYPIDEPIKIQTHNREIRQARRHILDLLLSKHHGECYSCFRNNNCELQTLAQEYGVDFYRFGRPKSPPPKKDVSSYSVIRDMSKCILCRRCVRTCIDMQEVGTLEVVNRSTNSRISTFMDKQLADVVCINCGQCINRCPTGALGAQDPTDEVWAAIDDPTKHVVLQTAPSPRAAIGECFGLEPGIAMTYQINTAARQAGFDAVFDTNFTADLTIMEEGTELLLRLHKAIIGGDKSQAFPQFTSCSPGWVKYLEHFYPEFIPNLSSAKSPQQMFGALIKTYYAERNGIDPANIVSVALMPCSAKKFECNRPEMRASGYKDVDYGLTTREMAQMFKECGVHLPDMEKSDFDSPFGHATGSGVIFGATGGVMESAIRTVFELVTGKKIESLFDHADVTPVRGFEGCRLAELTFTEVGPVPDVLKRYFDNWDWLKGVTLKVGVAHGTANAKRVMEDIKAGGPFSQCHFIEFMACPGGCLGGGGMPIPTSAEIRKARAKAIYDEDASYTVRKSYENPAIWDLYNNFLPEGPCSHKCHELLHTEYYPRGKYID